MNKRWHGTVQHDARQGFLQTNALIRIRMTGFPCTVTKKDEREIERFLSLIYQVGNLPFLKKRVETVEERVTRERRRKELHDSFQPAPYMRGERLWRRDDVGRRVAVLWRRCSGACSRASALLQFLSLFFAYFYPTFLPFTTLSVLFAFPQSLHPALPLADRPAIRTTFPFSFSQKANYSTFNFQVDKRSNHLNMQPHEHPCCSQ